MRVVRLRDVWVAVEMSWWKDNHGYGYEHVETVHAASRHMNPVRTYWSLTTEDISVVLSTPGGATMKISKIEEKENDLAQDWIDESIT